MKHDFFRKEALDHHFGTRMDGEVLLMVPSWTQWSSRLLFSALVVAAAFVLLAVVPEDADGHAVIRAEHSVSVTATSTGAVASVEVSPGARVEAGDVLVRFDSTNERAQNLSIQREFDSAIVRMLANPSDLTVQQVLAGLRVRKNLLAARLEESTVQAPVAGTVGDIRVKPGQNVTPGDRIMSIAGAESAFSVIAWLPSQVRPSLREGQPLSLEFPGYPHVSKALTIERVDERSVGPSEVRRMLGPEIADAIPATGRVVLIHSRLSDTSFVSEGEVYPYFDGMHATVRARVRSERLVTYLIPGRKPSTGPIR